MKLKLKVRDNTMDRYEVDHVLLGNAYGLPDKIDPERPVLDVGANIGTFAIACLLRGAGDVVCVEPHPGNFQTLQENLGRVTSQRPAFGAVLLNEAMWVRRGKVTLRGASDPVSTSMYTCVGDRPGKEVACATLDDYLGFAPEWEIVKLDCEGAEWPAIYGSRELRRAKKIIAELHVGRPVRGYVCTPEAMKRHMEAVGFRAAIRSTEDGVWNWILEATRR